MVVRGVGIASTRQHTIVLGQEPSVPDGQLRRCHQVRDWMYLRITMSFQLSHAGHVCNQEPEPHHAAKITVSGAHRDVLEPLQTFQI